MSSLNLTWVSETIVDDYLEWINGDVIRIEAQTGTGKTFFIKNKLLTHAIKDKKRILYICNRVNLKRQMKIDVGKIQNIKVNVDFNELDKLEEIGYITITSYQKIQYYLLNEKYGLNNNDNYTKYLNFDYIVMDECHYIVQDASFANETVFFYQDYLRQYSKDSITILISATMDYIKKPIEKIYNNMKLNIHDYTTGIDYSYLDVYYFKKYKDIINTINNDDSGDKWLVFINNVKIAKEMLGEIEDAKFVCSEKGAYAADNDKEVLENIIINNKFDCKCLIATKSLDNGINLDDPQLTNIVIIALDKIDFIQMLGRKRINIKDAQKVNLYIPAKSKKTFNTLLNTKYDKTTTDVIELFKTQRIQFNRNYDIKIDKLGKLSNLFYKGNNGWQLNEMGLLMFEKQKEFCEEMVKNFEVLGRESYILEQLSWLQLQYNPSNWLVDVVSDKEINHIQKYLDSIVGRKLFKDEQKELIDKIDLRDSRNRQQKSVSVLNAYFHENKMPYIITSKTSSQIIDGKKKSIRYWEVLNNITILKNTTKCG